MDWPFVSRKVRGKGFVRIVFFFFIIIAAVALYGLACVPVVHRNSSEKFLFTSFESDGLRAVVVACGGCHDISTQQRFQHQNHLEL